MTSIQMSRRIGAKCLSYCHYPPQACHTYFTCDRYTLLLHLVSAALHLVDRTGYAWCGLCSSQNNEKGRFDSCTVVPRLWYWVEMRRHSSSFLSAFVAIPGKYLRSKTSSKIVFPNACNARPMSTMCMKSGTKLCTEAAGKRKMQWINPSQNPWVKRHASTSTHKVLMINSRCYH